MSWDFILGLSEAFQELKWGPEGAGLLVHFSGCGGRCTREGGSGPKPRALRDSPDGKSYDLESEARFTRCIQGGKSFLPRISVSPLPQVVMKVDLVYEKKMLYLYVLSGIGAVVAAPDFHSSVQGRSFWKERAPNQAVESRTEWESGSRAPRREGGQPEGPSAYSPTDKPAEA